LPLVLHLQTDKEVLAALAELEPAAVLVMAVVAAVLTGPGRLHTAAMAAAAVNLAVLVVALDLGNNVRRVGQADIRAAEQKAQSVSFGPVQHANFRQLAQVTNNESLY
jgi:hypothetical protein